MGAKTIQTTVWNPEKGDRRRKKNSHSKLTTASAPFCASRLASNVKKKLDRIAYMKVIVPKRRWEVKRTNESAYLLLLFCFFSFPNIYSANRCARYFLLPSIFFPFRSSSLCIFTRVRCESEYHSHRVGFVVFFIYDSRRMRHCHSELIIIAFFCDFQKANNLSPAI